jgi:hypothetical protein
VKRATITDDFSINLRNVQDGTDITVLQDPNLKGYTFNEIVFTASGEDDVMFEVTASADNIVTARNKIHFFNNSLRRHANRQRSVATIRCPLAQRHLALFCLLGHAKQQPINNSCRLTLQISIPVGKRVLFDGKTVRGASSLPWPKSLGDSPLYREYWCRANGASSLPFLDDANCAKKFPGLVRSRSEVFVGARCERAVARWVRARQSRTGRRKSNGVCQRAESRQTQRRRHSDSTHERRQDLLSPFVERSPRRCAPDLVFIEDLCRR